MLEKIKQFGKGSVVVFAVLGVVAILLSPGIEQKAKAFCEQLDAEKDGQ